MSFSTESSKIEAQVNFLFQHSRLPDIRNRLEIIKSAVLNAEKIIEEDLGRMSESRMEEIRTLATKVHQKEIVLQKSIHEFKTRGQDLLNIVAEETKNYTNRAWQLKAEAERRRKTLQERSIARHRELESDITQMLQQAYAEIENRFDQCDLTEQNNAAQQHQQQMMMMMANMQQQNSNNGNQHYSAMNNDNNYNNHHQNSNGNNNSNSFGGFTSFSNNNHVNHISQQSNNNQNNNPFMMFRN